MLSPKANARVHHEVVLLHQFVCFRDKSVFYWKQKGFFAGSPVNTSNTFLYNALDLLEHVGVFFIDPVGQVATVIQDLIGWKGGQKRRATDKPTTAIM